MADLEIFSYWEKQVRTVLIDWVPYFVGTDVATVLWYKRPGNAVTRHCEDATLFQGIVDSLGKSQEMKVIPESDVYSLIFSSKLENAKEFKKWVTGEVIPSIRKNWSYGAPLKKLSTLEMLEEAVVELKKKDSTILKLETSNRQLNDTNARIFEMKAKDTKGGLKVLMDNLGAEINTAIIKKYNEQCAWDHRSMHRAAWNDYFLETNTLYRWAKTASLKSKKDFLAWLNHGGSQNLLKEHTQAGE